ncbi:hypothetical protein KBK19_09660 [Microvirga sp. STR05]|uniref:Carboxypeptidase regulatory-like domain-containing protein n=1 Tax=Hymenobacter duratus TaxID=2771356 RepID=A0ABR8JHT6_9BACT|nr:DUF6252 family protein [Hymenobacter duratus]MBD2715301.1 hypothetical protein [Hymenobacter duratus]MBR7950208.1 hypothetical protein [Microvirga sp. STR05]
MIVPAFFRAFAASLTVAFLLALTGCHKEEIKPSRPAPATTGTLEGRLQPIGSADSILLHGAGFRRWSVAPDARTGLFRFTQLPPGNYLLGAVPVADYLFTSNEAQELMVKVGDTTRTLLTLPRAVRVRGTISWEMNGVRYSVPATSGEFTADKFTIEGSSAPDANQESHSLTLVISQAGLANARPFSGVGTYPLGGSVYPYARYTFTRGGNFDQYTTMYSFQPVGTITVSQFDSVARRAAGRFEFIGTYYSFTPGTGAATPSQRITNGEFAITF